MKILYMCNFISIVHIPFVCGKAIHLYRPLVQLFEDLG